jgi:hypothetical protein
MRQEGVLPMATSPQDAMACYPSRLMMGASWVGVVRPVPQRNARL